MINPIGKYARGYTFFHKQDPRVKFVFIMAMIISLFASKHLITVAFLLFVSVTSFLITTRSIRMFARMLYVPLYIFFALFFFNSLTIQDYASSVENQKISSASTHLAEFTEPVYWDFQTNSWEKVTGIFYDFQTGEWTNKNILWWKIGGIKITPVAVIRAFAATLRVLCMILVTKILTYSTHPVLFTKAIEDIFYPLSWVKVPVQIFAMVLSITYRFIPTLWSEAWRILKAQTSRGADMSGSFVDRVQGLTSLIIPLFVTSFNKAWELSESMEARHYDPMAKRTRYRVIKSRWVDLISLCLIVTVVILIYLLKYNVLKVPYWYAVTYQSF